MWRMATGLDNAGLNKMSCRYAFVHKSRTRGDGSILVPTSFIIDPLDILIPQGMCCAFNKEDADRIFIDSKYTRILERLESHEKLRAFDKAENLPWYKDEPKSQAGRKRGLEVILDAHTDLLTEFSIATDFQVSISTTAFVCNVANKQNQNAYY